MGSSCCVHGVCSQEALASLDLFAAAGARREGLVWWQERRQRKAPCLYNDAIATPFTRWTPQAGEVLEMLIKSINSSARVYRMEEWL